MAIVCATAMFVLGRAPGHAAGWQYIVTFWPGIVLLGAVVLRRAPHPALVMTLVVILMGTFAWEWQQFYRRSYSAQRVAVEEVSNATLVVADCMLRGYTPGAAMWVPKDSEFLLAARDGRPAPPIPEGADRSRAFLLHVEGCPVGVRDVDGLLQSLGLVRSGTVGPIGYVMVERLQPR
jgi:hypothetical protein